MDLEKIVEEVGESPTLDADIPTGILLKVQGVEANVRCNLVGMQPPLYLILAPPRLDSSVRQKMVPGASLVAKYVYRGSIFAFQSQVVGTVEKPVSLLLASYPQIVSRQEFRKDKRFTCYMAGMAQMGEQNWKGAILDISKSGCRFLSKITQSNNPPDLEVEDRLTISFGVGQTQAPLSLPSVIRNHQADRQMVSLGLEFSDMDSDNEGSLALFLGSLDEYTSLAERLKAD